MTPEEIVDARQTRIDAEAAWAILQNASSISVAKGKKIQQFTPTADSREAILQQTMGPSGHLRAPTFRCGDAYLIGFNPELYAQWFS
ncbi:MAG: hypothetical protein GW875_13445 [Deltaproteobacteria bacterium]|nr:hypothetical protein [Deltaproteobacteria bacterium]NCP02254.1 hypothetical protein [Deltaproteobacteria bacterium]NCP78510.1 hypothetical protein [Desulfuromonadales bacterium]